MNFWQTPEWIKAKQSVRKTEEVMTRVEFLREVGHKEYSEKLYQEYLQVMKSMKPENEEDDRSRD